MFAEIEIELKKKATADFLDNMLEQFRVGNSIETTSERFLIDKRDFNLIANVAIELEHYFCLISFQEDDNYIKIFLERNNNPNNLNYLKNSLADFRERFIRFTNKKLNNKVDNFSVIILDNDLNVISNGYYRSIKKILKDMAENHKLRLFSIPLGLFIFELMNKDFFTALYSFILPSLLVLFVHTGIVVITSKKDLVYE